MASKKHIFFSPQELSEPLTYIDEYWSQLRRYQPHDTGTLIGLPHPYFVPSRGEKIGFSFEELYYWDSYFTALGLLDTSREQMAFYILDNLVELLRRFGMVPNGNRFYLTSHSQPPFLTSFIFELYSINQDKRWLEKYMEAAKYEYRDVWLGSRQPHWRKVFKGLSRYYDTNVLHDLAEAESGWDMTTRFGRQCLNYVPVDLNALLYKYERDFADAALILGEVEEAKEWSQRAERRKYTMNKYLWDSDQGFYFDYNFVTGRQSEVYSLAGFYPMWAGMASEEQSQQMVSNLGRFEHEGGLATTAEPPTSESDLPTQWAYPNGWAPLHLLLAEGLEQYGYDAVAQRVVRKWLATNLDYFQRYGEFCEKYNVVEPGSEPAKGLYPMQKGFGWTSAIFNRLCFEFLYEAELPEGFVDESQTTHSRSQWLKHKLHDLRVKFLRSKTEPSF